MNPENNLAGALERFLAAEDPPQILAMVAEEDALRSEAALAGLAALIEAEPDPERQAFLIERRQLLDTLHQMAGRFDELQAQLESLPEAERQFLAFMAIPNSLGMAALVAGSDDEALETLQAAAAAKLAAAGDEEAAGIQARLDDLAGLRAAGRDASQARLDAAQAAANRLGDSLTAWIQTPDWGASEQYLTDHTADLLSDDGETALDLLQLANPGNEQIPMHRQLLRFAREQGIEAAYAQLRRELAQMEELGEPGELEELREAARQMAESPVLQAIAEFVSVEGDDAARRVLASRRDVLLTAEARGMLEQLVAVARQQGDAAPQARLEARVALWNEAWRAATGGPLRGRGDEPWQAQPESERLDRLERQPLAAERAAKYTVVTAKNSAIGDNAQVLNIFDIGELPLAWSRPQETRPDLAAAAVGRMVELDELHRRLSEGDVALVGVRGLAGVGKTVLAAMYATRYAAQFPGGVIWVNVGPQVRQPVDVTPLLQRLAAYAYNRDLRVAWLDDLVFAPDAVQVLLGGRGRLLLVFDDVWSQEAATALHAAAPPGSAILLTTRDRRVAYALGNGPDAIQELDVLSELDARALLQKRAPGLPYDLADRVAAKLGRHAQALSLAAAALHLRGRQRYGATADELLRRVAVGAGFGDLPNLDQADKQTDVEIALKYTYDYLGEHRGQGAQWQACLRTLGSFAQEVSFDAGAAAALWQMLPEQAEELLLLFDQLALVQEHKDGGRWQQHAILRAYGLSLQDQTERLDLPQRHADHYLELARASIPSATDRVALEFPQIEHAFDWCRQHSPSRAVGLATLVSQVMFIRGRATQANEWLRASLDAADQTGDRGGKANTLKSLGDLESRLGNIDAARGHYDAALPLYEAEQARLGKANTLKSLGDLESRLGNIDAARGHYDAALSLFELERDPMGRMNVYIGRARMAASEGNISEAKAFFEMVFQIAEQIGFANHPVTQNLRREYETLGVLPQNSAQRESLRQAVSDPLTVAISALLRIDSDQALVQTLHDHPILVEADALFALAGLISEALKQQQSETVARLALFLALLLEQYNYAHSEQIDLEKHQAVIEQVDQAIPLAEQIDAGLAAALRQQAGQACNTLGNHFADHSKDPDQAIAAYTRGAGFDPQNAMLLRNRAGVHIDRQDRAAAEADIRSAAALEPDAPRLTDLRATLEQLP